MKKQILFVDDEPNILKGLQRSLRPLRKYWDMKFAEGGANALQVLEEKQYDVIVSDMRMPEMDGAKLLSIVQEKYPMMVRIILSGHSDQEMILQSVKSAHQYLSKPCEKKLLVTAITRSCSLNDLLGKEELQQLLGGIKTMPSIPALYTKIMNELSNEDASVASIGDIIAQDMGMTAKVLQLVNSSFFGMPRHISNAQEAVVLLGIDVVKGLVLGIEVFSTFSKSTMSIISVDKIHDHCVKTGMKAKKIAEIENMDKKLADNAMIASILHDLGKLLMAEHFFDKYSEAVQLATEKDISVFQAETEIFGVSHAEVGAYILGLWGLPTEIIEGIAFHHYPSKYFGKDFSICGLLHVADIIDHHLTGNEQNLIGVDQAYVDKFDLEPKIPVWRETLAQED